MVRLEEGTSNPGGAKKLVSIPIWCDWKPEFCNCKILDTSVSIPIWCDWKDFVRYFAKQVYPFQFLYGAIGRKHEGWSYVCHDRFNSYMVRLEAWRIRHSLQRWFVSIPIWCDWKTQTIQNQIWKETFQFLYGAIGSSQLNRIIQHFLCFNSYMVRLEGPLGDPDVKFSNVSIPIWCDWKPSRLLRWVQKRRVSIPIWCDWKYHFTGIRLKPNQVSIPIWCDWKYSFSARPIYVTSVSIPIWCDWKLKAFSSLDFFILKVSIPIWCDWKDGRFNFACKVSLFQFLYGAIGRLA